MIANPNTVRSPESSHDSVTPPLRLQLDPNRPAHVHLDGSFWPRSRDLSAELPTLLTTISADFGPIALVGYHRDGWNPAPDHIMFGDRDVHVEGFVSDSPPTMVVIADNGQCVTLRVLAPDTDAESAAAAMVSVAAPRATGADGDPQGSPASNNQARSLEELTSRLARHAVNPGAAGTKQISRLVTEAAEQFSEAPIQAFVPILVDHIVRGQLQHAPHD
ncbi:MAG: DUF5994 family protein [Mycobacterium sp.]